MREFLQINIYIEKHLERTGDADYPIVAICDRIMINGKEIEIPKRATVTVSCTTKALQ